MFQGEQAEQCKKHLDTLVSTKVQEKRNLMGFGMPAEKLVQLDIEIKTLLELQEYNNYLIEKGEQAEAKLQGL